MRKSSVGDDIVVRGEVWAEYTKRLSYTVDVCIDSHQVIKEAQCRCTAGEGPTGHCKHVATVLYAVQCVGCHKDLLTEQTCTQVKLFYY